MAFIHLNSVGEIQSIEFTSVGTTYSIPATPAAGQIQFYFKTDKKPYYKDDTGTEVGFLTTGASIFLDNAFTLEDDGDNTKQLQFQLSGLTTATLRTLTAPDANDTLAVLALAQTFTNKTLGNTNTVTLKDTLFTLQDNGDVTKQVQLELSGLTTATTRSYGAPDGNGTLVLDTLAQALTNKTLGNTNSVTLKDTLFTLQDDGDVTKQAQFQLSGLTTGALRSFSLPDYNATLATIAGVETLTNKTLTTPTIGDFTNATHTHQNAAGGGQLNAGLVFSAGQVPLARGGTNADLSATGGANQFLKQTSSGGAITVAGITSGDLTTALTTPPAIGATTPGTGKFTNITIVSGGYIRPDADGTSALLITKADGTTVVGRIDTTDSFVSFGPAAGTPTKVLDLYYGDVKFNTITAPGALTAALAGLGAGNVDNGDHIYRVTFVNAAGETNFGTASTTVTTADKTVNGQNALSAIPLGVAGQGVTSRKIYRTKIGSSTNYFLLTTIADNTTTTFTDNVADASLGASTFIGTQTDNSTAGTFYIGAAKSGFVRQNNVAWGLNALGSVTTGIQNAAFGGNVLLGLTTSSNNAFFGYIAGQSLTTGQSNTAFGSQALFSLISGGNNLAIGVQAGRSVTSSSNTLVGPFAGYNTGSTLSTANAITTGTDNTFLGYTAGLESSTQRNFAIAIGSGASVDASNTAVIGGTVAANQVDIASGLVTASAKLHLRKLTALTSQIQDMTILDHDTSNTPVTSFGLASRWRGRTSTTAAQDMARQRVTWTDSPHSHATRTSEQVFSVYDFNGERDAFKSIADGTGAIFSVLAGLRLPWREVTAAGAITATNQDVGIAVNKTTGAATTVNLPAAVDGQTFVVKDKKKDCAANNITLTPSGTDTIESGASFVMNSNGMSVTITAKNGNWSVW